MKAICFLLVAVGALTAITAHSLLPKYNRPLWALGTIIFLLGWLPLVYWEFLD
jgi:hypothetical protein